MEWVQGGNPASLTMLFKMGAKGIDSGNVRYTWFQLPQPPLRFLKKERGDILGWLTLRGHSQQTEYIHSKECPQSPFPIRFLTDMRL